VPALPAPDDLPARRGGVVIKLLVFVGATIGGSIGWWIGARVGTMTAFMVSIVGTAIGVYYTRRWIATYL
jgi:hypothetical protein